jgi:hypothetical protein
MGTKISTVVFRALVLLFILLEAGVGIALLGVPIFGEKLHLSLGDTFSLLSSLIAALLVLSHSLIKAAHK